MKWLRSCVLVLGIAVLGGCLSRPNLARQSFTFAMPPTTNARATNGPILGIRRIVVASPFNTQELTYRTGPFSYERDPYAGFLVSPAESLAEPLRGYLRDSGSFHVVTEPDSELAPNVELEITVSQIYGDFRNQAHPIATIEMRFLAFENSGASAKVLLQKDYGRNIPLQSRTAAALVAGWNEGLRQIAAEAAQDLAQATQVKPD